MIRVLLIHAGIIPHYRVPIYGYMSRYLRQYGFELIIASNGIQSDNPYPVEFPYDERPLSAFRIARLILKRKVEVIIDYMELRHRFLFPTYMIVKGILRRKIIYWGQGRDLLDPHSKIKNFAYAVELAFCDAIVLYADSLKKYVPKRFHKKTFVANNTLHLSYPGLPLGATRESMLAEYGIGTKKNIICIGRMQKRKRIHHLFEAFVSMNRPDIGLILVGPDPEGVLDKIEGDNIFKLGAIYGDRKYDLLSSADIFCLPGAVGLSIVDAFFCGLPFVTEEGDNSAEIMYLKDGVNGFLVPKGDIPRISRQMMLLLDDDELRKRFSEAAKQEIKENGSLKIFCEGFQKALFYVVSKISRESLPLGKRDSR
jgi:glycosyltransferase involved in cell wall biosynthesis